MDLWMPVTPEEVQFHTALANAFLGIGLGVAIVLFFVAAPYGRHTRGGWGPTIDSKIAWIAQEAPSSIVFFMCWLRAGRPLHDTILWIFFVCWELHYINRAFVYPFRMRGTKRTPVLIPVSAFLFCLVNGYLNGQELFSFVDPYPLNYITSMRFIVGLLLWVVGFGVNYHSDGVLRGLRRQTKEKGEYMIPRGGAFTYVTNANYSGEIVEWIGWAIMTRTYAGFVFAVWTAANLVPRAMKNHQWYQKTFPAYPKDRKVLVPFVF